MTTKEEIKSQVDKLPNDSLDEVYAYLKMVAERDKQELTEEENKKRWKEWWDNLENIASSDFMNERIQPPLQTRENMFE